jgi:hypothetical protein
MNLTSAKTLYNLAQKEYELENDRGKVLDTKANMLLVLCFPPLLFIFNTSTTWNAFINLFSKNKNMISYEYSISLIIVILTCIFIGFILASIRNILNIIDLKSYERLSISSMKDDLFRYNTENDFSLFAAIKYDLAITENRKINDEKAALFGSACSFLLYDTFIFVLYFIVLKLSGLN